MALEVLNSSYPSAIGTSVPVPSEAAASDGDEEEEEEEEPAAASPFLLGWAPPATQQATPRGRVSVGCLSSC